MLVWPCERMVPWLRQAAVSWPFVPHGLISLRPLLLPTLVMPPLVMIGGSTAVVCHTWWRKERRPDRSVPSLDTKRIHAARQRVRGKERDKETARAWLVQFYSGWVSVFVRRTGLLTAGCGLRGVRLACIPWEESRKRQDNDRVAERRLPSWAPLSTGARAISFDGKQMRSDIAAQALAAPKVSERQ